MLFTEWPSVSLWLVSTACDIATTVLMHLLKRYKLHSLSGRRRNCSVLITHNRLPISSYADTVTLLPLNHTTQQRFYKSYLPMTFFSILEISFKELSFWGFRLFAYQLWGSWPLWNTVIHLWPVSLQVLWCSVSWNATNTGDPVVLNLIRPTGWAEPYT